VGVKKKFTNSPVFTKDDKWYFWDETWAYKHGPFENELDASLALYNYCIQDLGMPEGFVKKPGEKNDLQST